MARNAINYPCKTGFAAEHNLRSPFQRNSPLFMKNGSSLPCLKEPPPPIDTFPQPHLSNPQFTIRYLEQTFILPVFFYFEKRKFITVPTKNLIDTFPQPALPSPELLSSIFITLRTGLLNCLNARSRGLIQSEVRFL